MCGVGQSQWIRAKSEGRVSVHRGVTVWRVGAVGGWGEMLSWEVKEGRQSGSSIPGGQPGQGGLFWKQERRHISGT